MKKTLPLLSLLVLCALPLAAQTKETPTGKVPEPSTASQVKPPAEVEEAVRLEAERASIRSTLIAALKAAEKQAAEAAKTGGKEASAAIYAVSVGKQKEQAVRLQEIEARLQAIRPEAKASEPARVR